MGEVNVFSVRGYKGTQISSWMSRLARCSTMTDDWRHDLREGGAPQPRVSPIGLLPLFGRSCVATVCCGLRFGCDCSPALWEPAHDPGRI